LKVTTYKKFILEIFFYDAKMDYLHKNFPETVGILEKIKLNMAKRREPGNCYS
jgi:hypothetical protein